MHLFTFIKAVASHIDHRLGGTDCRDHVVAASTYLNRVCTPFDLHATFTMALSVIMANVHIPQTGIDAVRRSSKTTSARQMATIFLCIPIGELQRGAWPTERYDESDGRAGAIVRESFYSFISAAIHQTVSAGNLTQAAAPSLVAEPSEQIHTVLRWGLAMQVPDNIRALEAALAEMPDTEKKRFMEFMAHGITDHECACHRAFVDRVAACRMALRAKPLN